MQQTCHVDTACFHPDLLIFDIYKNDICKVRDEFPVILLDLLTTESVPSPMYIYIHSVIAQNKIRLHHKKLTGLKWITRVFPQLQLNEHTLG